MAVKCFPDIWAPYQLSVFTSVISAILATVAILGNSVIVAIVIKDPLKKLHSPFNYFLVNLAASDLIFGAIVLPISTYNHAKESTGETDSSTKTTLRLTYFISSTSSLVSLIVLSVDRYSAITRAVHYRQYLSYKRCIIVSVCIWIVSVSTAFIYYALGYLHYLIVYASVALAVGLIVMVTIYIRVYLFLRQHTNRLRRDLRISSRAVSMFNLKQLLLEKKVTRAFLMMIIVFVSTYIPAVVSIYIFYFCITCNCDLRHVLRDVQFLLVAFGSCVNPFICTIRLKHFRESLKTVVMLQPAPNE